MLYHYWSMSTSVTYSGNSTQRRTSSVYVEIPAFDKELYFGSTTGAPHVSPLTTKNNGNTMSTPASVKRKLSDRDQDCPAPAADDVAAKRQRAASNAAAGSASAPLKLSQLNSPSKPSPIEVDLSKASTEFPNGFAYCHQCCKKRDLGGGCSPAPLCW